MLKRTIFLRLVSIATIVMVAGNAGGFQSPTKSHGSLIKTREAHDWPVYGGRPQNDHYSPLDQINRKNVSHLHVAWSFDTGEKGGLQTSPLVVGRVMFGYTPSQKVIALDAVDGRQLWRFDSGIHGTQPARGLTYWQSGGETRLFAGVMNFLYALDPATGKPIASFGEDGRVDLRKQLRGEYLQNSIALTSPGVIYKDLIIVGGRNPETHPAPPGDIRAFDVRTGELRWSFHTIPHPGEAGYETWPATAWKRSGAANNWAGMTVDTGRGVVFAPTGSATFDFYGGDRLGDDLYSNSILALDAATGKRLWHFQGVHHDVWDRDFPSAPVQFQFRKAGKQVDAIAQTTKQGYIYVFDRNSGKPLFPVEELPYGASKVPGEVTAPTQPRPVLPAPFARQRLTADMLTTRTPEAHQFAKKIFDAARSDGQFVPFSLDKLTIVFPGFDGGGEWGGPALDPRTNVLYVNANEMAWLGGLTPARAARSAGEKTYQQLCSVCHGANGAGAPPAFPSLLGVGSRMSEHDINLAIQQGKGRMPAFPALGEARMASLIEHLRQMGSEGQISGKELSSVVAPTSQHPAIETTGSISYRAHCAICHGDQREGIAESFPALLGLETRMSREQTLKLIVQGKGRMPGFAKIPTGEMDALLGYLNLGSGETGSAKPEGADDNAFEMPYQFTGYSKFLDQDGYPAVSPPWGTLTAISLDTGKSLWSIPFGEYPELRSKGFKQTGSENYGGPIVTAGNILFIGATIFDKKFHAFDTGSGKSLWEVELPFAGLATPVTYMVDGKQFVLIATGGGRDPKAPSGGEYVAFSLP